MRRRHPRATTLLLSIALASMISACTASHDAPTSLADALGRPPADDFEAQHRNRTLEHDRVEQLIVECMADRGFDYQPVGLPPDPRADSGLTAEEYRERYGYGMMSSTRGSLLGEDGWISPNTEFVERLEEATAYAWQTALHGENPFDYETRDGCRDQAEDEVNAYLATDEWNELEGLLEVLEERIASDPRTIAAEARWAACMAEAGYEVTDEDDLLWLIDESLFAAYESEPPPPGEPPVDNRYAVQPWFVETEAWDELVQFELDIAARDAACTEDTGVRAEYEQQFLEQHAELVERVRELQ